MKLRGYELFKLSNMPGILESPQNTLGKRKRPTLTKGVAARSHEGLRTSTTDAEAEAAHSELEKSSESGSSAERVEDDDEDDERQREAFRRAFEKRFAPLPGTARIVRDTTDTKSSGKDRLSISMSQAVDAEDSDDWSGFRSGSDEEEEDEADDPSPIQIINYATTSAEDDAHDEFTEREAKRAFMSSRPPSAGRNSTARSKGNDDDEDAQTAQDHLKKDLELSRLIQESHLLSKNSAAAQQPAKQDYQGRLKTTESRLAALGAKDTVLKQRNVPNTIRYGIKNKEREREQKRRKEAQENGIVLEKAQAKKRGNTMEKKRERSVGNPGVGKFKGGTLTLGKRDLSKLTTPKSALMKGRKGRKGGAQPLPRF